MQPSLCGNIQHAVKVSLIANGDLCAHTGLRGKLPKAINLPASITVPFGSFEEVLNQSSNKQIKKQLEAAIKDIPVEKAEEALAKCRELVMQVCLHLYLQQNLMMMMMCSFNQGQEYVDGCQQCIKPAEAHALARTDASALGFDLCHQHLTLQP